MCVWGVQEPLGKDRELTCGGCLRLAGVQEQRTKCRFRLCLLAVRPKIS